MENMLSHATLRKACRPTSCTTALLLLALVAVAANYRFPNQGFDHASSKLLRGVIFNRPGACGVTLLEAKTLSVITGSRGNHHHAGCNGAKSTKHFVVLLPVAPVSLVFASMYITRMIHRVTAALVHCPGTQRPNPHRRKSNPAAALALLMIAVIATASAASTYSTGTTGHFRQTGPDGLTHTNAVPLSVGYVAMKSDVRAVAEYSDDEFLWADSNLIYKVNYWTYSASIFAGQSTTGYITTASKGTGSSWKIQDPRGLMKDPIRNCWLVNAGRHQVVKLYSDGDLQLLAGSLSGTSGYTNGQGTTARFNTLYNGVVANSHMYLLSDGSNNCIRSLTPEGYADSYLLSGVNSCHGGSMTTASLEFPTPAIDAMGRVWITSANRGAIALLHAITSTVEIVVGQCGSTSTSSTTTFGTDTMLSPGAVVNVGDTMHVIDQSSYFRTIEPLSMYRSPSFTTHASDPVGGRLHAEGHGIMMNAETERDYFRRDPKLLDYMVSFQTWVSSTATVPIVEISVGRVVAHYAFDGTRRDTSGNEHHLASLGSGLSTASDYRDVPSGAMTFDGTTAALAVVPNAVMDFLVSYCVCMWVEVTAFPATLFSVTISGTTPFIDVWTDGTDLTMTHASSTYTQSYFLGASTGWRHLCAWRDGARIGTSIQGIKEMTAVNTLVSTGLSTSGDTHRKRVQPTGIVIGQRQGSALGTYTRSLAGRIGDVTFLNYMPTQSEIQLMMREEYPMKEKTEVWTVHALAGWASGSASGQSSSATLTYSKQHTPEWNTLEAPVFTGAILFTDTGNHCVRRVDSDGNVNSNSYGSGTSGNQPGAATSARFTSPRGFTLMSYALGYFLYSEGGYFYRIDPDAAQVDTQCAYASTLSSSDGACGTAAGYTIRGLTKISDTEWWWGERDGNRIRRYTYGGTIETIMGSTTAGCTTGTNALLTEPDYSQYDPLSQRFYFSDVSTSRIGVIDLTVVPYAVVNVAGRCDAETAPYYSYIGEGGGNGFLSQQTTFDGFPDTASLFLTSWSTRGLFKFNKQTAEYTHVTTTTQFSTASEGQWGRAFHGGTVDGETYGLDSTREGAIIIGSFATNELKELIPGLQVLHHTFSGSSYTVDSVTGMKTFMPGSGVSRTQDHRGVSNRGVLLDGTSNGKLDMDPTAMDLVSSYSICMWMDLHTDSDVVLWDVTPTTTQQQISIASNVMRVYSRAAPTLDLTSALVSNQGWKHLCWTKNGMEYHVFLDGVVVGSRTTNDPSDPKRLKVRSSAFRIGDKLSGSQPAPMAVADLQVFNYAVIPSEVAHLMERSEREDEIWTVRLVAGSSLGISDGIGSAAQFTIQEAAVEHPTVSAALLVADLFNHCIRVVPINSVTMTSTFSGSCGSASTAFGDAATTRLNQPGRMSHDLYNNRYYVEQAGNKGIITAMETTGATSLYCGTSGSTGSSGTTCGAAAVFDHASSFAVASATTLYVPSTSSHEIRRVDNAATVTTVVGTGRAGCEAGPGATAVTSRPMALTLDGAGNLWFRLHDGTGNINPLLARIAAAELGTTYTVEIVIGKCLQEMPASTYSSGIGSYTTDGFGPNALVGHPYYMLYEPTSDSILLSQHFGAVRRIDAVSLEVSTVEALDSGSTAEGRLLHGGSLSGGLCGVARLSYYPESIFVGLADKMYELIRGTLRALYRMHGNGVDASGNGYHMTTLGSGATAVSGPSGKAATALSFDQTVNAYGVLPSVVLERTADFSLCFFGDIGADNDVTFVSVATAEDAGFVTYGTSGGSSNELTYGVSGTQVTATHTQALQSTGWHHYCVGKHGASLFIMVDGVSAASQAGIATTMMVRAVRGVVVGQTQSSPLAGYSASTALLGGMSELHVYNYAVVESEAERLRRAIDPNEQETWSLRLVAGQEGSRPRGTCDGTASAAGFVQPKAVALLGSDLIVGDFMAYCMRRVTMEGVVTTFSGRCQKQGYTDGVDASRTEYDSLYALYYDATNNVLVVPDNNYLKTVTTGGVSTKLAGLASNGYDNSPGSVRFNGIYSVTMSGGNYITTDSNNNRMRQVTTTGFTTLAAGSGAGAGCVPGSGSSADFSKPDTIVTDGTGNMWFTVKLGTEYYAAKMTAGFVVSFPFGCVSATPATDGLATGSGEIHPKMLYYDSVLDALLVTDGSADLRVLMRLDLATNYIRTIAQGTRSAQYEHREGRVRYPWPHLGGFYQSARTTAGSYVLAGQTTGVVELVPGSVLAKYTNGLSVTDTSGNANHMTMHNVVGADQSFDGTTATLAVVPNSALQIVSSYSLCFNLMVSVGVSAATFLSIATADGVRHVEVWYSEEALHFRHGERVFTHGGKLRPAVHHHYCFMKDGQELRVYRRGRGVTSHPSAGRLKTGVVLTALGIVVGQAQCSVLGDYDVGLSLRGSVTELLMTNYALEFEELGRVMADSALPSDSVSFTSTVTMSTPPTSSASATIDSTASQSIPATPTSSALATGSSTGSTVPSASRSLTVKTPTATAAASATTDATISATPSTTLSLDSTSTVSISSTAAISASLTHEKSATKGATITGGPFTMTASLTQSATDSAASTLSQPGTFSATSTLQPTTTIDDTATAAHTSTLTATVTQSTTNSASSTLLQSGTVTTRTLSTTATLSEHRTLTASVTRRVTDSAALTRSMTLSATHTLSLSHTAASSVSLPGGATKSMSTTSPSSITLSLVGTTSSTASVSPTSTYGTDTYSTTLTKANFLSITRGTSSTSATTHATQLLAFSTSATSSLCTTASRTGTTESTATLQFTRSGTLVSSPTYEMTSTSALSGTVSVPATPTAGTSSTSSRGQTASSFHTITLSFHRTKSLLQTATRDHTASVPMSSTVSPMPYTPAPPNLPVQVQHTSGFAIWEAAINGQGNYTDADRTIVFEARNDEFVVTVGTGMTISVASNPLQDEIQGFNTHMSTIAASTRITTNRTHLVAVLGLAPEYAISGNERVNIQFSAAAMRSGRINQPNGGTFVVVAQLNSDAGAAQAVVTAAVGATMAASAANPSSGEVQTTVLLGLMKCGSPKDRQATKDAEVLIAPLLIGEGRRGMLLGNGLLIIGLVTLFAIAFAVLRWWKRAVGDVYYTSKQACQSLKFPSLFVSFAQFLHQGTVFAAAALMTEEESSVLDRFLGALGTTYAIVVVCLTLYWSQRLINGMYAHYAALFHPVLSRLPFMRFILPEGCWGPEWFYSMYGSLIAPLRREGTIFAAFPLTCTTVMAFTAGLNVGTSSAACGAKYIFMCLIVGLAVLLILVCRPYRSLMMNVLLAGSQSGLLMLLIVSTMQQYGHSVQDMYLRAVFAQSATSMAASLYMVAVAVGEVLMWRRKVWHNVLVIERTEYTRPLIRRGWNTYEDDGELVVEETAEERETRIKTTVSGFLNSIEAWVPPVVGRRNRNGVRNVTVEDLV